MPADFNAGFFVREPAWHKMGVVLDDYPGREDAMRLAGHDFEVIEYAPFADVGGAWVPVPGVKVFAARRGGQPDRLLPTSSSRTFEPIQNSVAWDVVDAMVGEGARYETGILLAGGTMCSVLAYLPEPVTIPGDDSEVFPWVNVSWGHKPGAPLSCRATSIRTVCRNTQTMAEAQGLRTGRNFTFRHTRNVLDRIDEARDALTGVRVQHADYVRIATEMAETRVSQRQRELFVTEFIPKPPEAMISDRVARNVEAARGAVRALFDGPTIPGDHRFTAYGLHLAGGEYLDHLRGYRTNDTLYGRQLMSHDRMKARMAKVIREVVAA